MNNRPFRFPPAGRDPARCHQRRRELPGHAPGLEAAV